MIDLTKEDMKPSDRFRCLAIFQKLFRKLECLGLCSETEIFEIGMRIASGRWVTGKFMLSQGLIIPSLF